MKAEHNELLVRSGPVPAGEVSVVVAVGGGHRDAAFAACEAESASAATSSCICWTALIVSWLSTVLPVFDSAL